MHMVLVIFRELPWGSASGWVGNINDPWHPDTIFFWGEDVPGVKFLTASWLYS